MSNVLTGDYLAAEEGKFFTSWQAATANTAVATATQALGNTSPHLVIWNGQPAGGKNIYMKKVEFGTTAVATGRTTLEHVGVLNGDTAAHTTTGTLMSSPINVNGDSGEGSLTVLYAGVNVMATPAAGSRIVHTGRVQPIIPIVLDSWNFVYGEGSLLTAAPVETLAKVKMVNVALPPVIIAPQTFYTLGLWGASNGAAADTVRTAVSWIEQ